MELAQRIEQFSKMATDDPENELAHFRLGQLLMEADRTADAAASFARTLQLNPEFSKVYQLLGECHAKLGDPAKAVEVLTQGYAVAEERGDKMPRDAMGKLLLELGAPIPTVAPAAADDDDDSPGTGFRCERPGCTAGKRARALPAPPMPDELGARIAATICSDCWQAWFKDYSVKVINELRLDLSSEQGSAEYDRHMLEFFGFDEPEN